MSVNALLRQSCWLAMLPLLFGCVTANPGPGARPVTSDQSSMRATRKFEAVLASYTEARKHLDAFSAPYYDVEDDLDEFGDYASPEYFARAKRICADALMQLTEVDPRALESRARRTHALFHEDLTVTLRGFDFPGELLEFNQKGNRLLRYMDDANPALTNFPFDSVKHYDDFVKRAEGFPAYVERQIDLFRRGMERGVVHSCPIVDETVETYAAALEPRVEKNPFWRPLMVMPASIGDADRARITDGFRRMITAVIVPGYRKLDRFLRREYRPHCRADFGLGTLPGGAEWYRHQILVNTNLPLSPSEVHETGLREVARIRHTMDAVRKEVGFGGTLQEFLRATRNDPGSYFTDAEALFAAFLRVKEDVAALVPRYFSARPTHDYAIVSASTGQSAAGQYYTPTENHPEGRFVVNTINLKSVQKGRVPTLSLHEAVPGHHMQLALEFEMKDRLPEYQRKMFGSNAFSEGWALYAEYLGREMGVYKTPMERLGNLNDEMFRAVRLVVDTGIHAYGWSQAEARAYMAKHLAHDAQDIESEVNRYSVWPGQALGYKIGELKIRELRQRSEAALAAAFDLREFHDVVLGSGTVSLRVLEQHVEEWLASKHRGTDDRSGGVVPSAGGH